MANHISALKRVRQTKKRQIRNRAALSSVKTVLKRLTRALSAKNMETIRTEMKTATSTLAKAASKGIIPKKRASRKTSRLALKANQILQASK